MIPKIIWQTHENKYKDLEPFQKNIVNTWKNLNPGWEYNYVTAEERHEHIKKYDNFLYECYKLSPAVNQTDIWRLIVIYEYGGFYADMDSVCTRPLDDIMLNCYNNEDMICSPIAYQHYGVNNSNFAGLKNSKIIKLMLDKATEKCIKFKESDPVNILNSHIGQPCNGLFSSIALKNTNKICFNNEYFLHSLDYKVDFNKKYNIFYKQKKMFYLDLANENNWIIY
jgi:hypothetical protein